MVRLMQVPHEYLTLYVCLDRMIFACREGRVKDAEMINTSYSRTAHRIYKQPLTHDDVMFDELRRLCLSSIDGKIPEGKRREYLGESERMFDVMPLPSLI